MGYNVNIHKSIAGSDIISMEEEFYTIFPQRTFIYILTITVMKKSWWKSRNSAHCWNKRNLRMDMLKRVRGTVLFYSHHPSCKVAMLVAKANLLVRDFFHEKGEIMWVSIWLP